MAQKYNNKQKFQKKKTKTRKKMQNKAKYKHKLAQTKGLKKERKTTNTNVGFILLAVIHYYKLFFLVSKIVCWKILSENKKQKKGKINKQNQQNNK